jgi:predicted nucleic acid-binding protein
MMLVGFDTNILLYAVDSTGDVDKHESALALLDRASAVGRGLLPLQALSEFYAVAVRKLRAEPGQASSYVEVWSDVFPVHPAGLADVADAMRVHRQHGIAFWDAMMWSVVRRAGARLLLSEDLQDGRELEGVRFANPFNPANVGLLADALGSTY